MKRKLYTTKTCVNCPSAKLLLDTRGIMYEKVDAESLLGTERESELHKYGILSVPALIIEKDDGFESYNGLDNIRKYIENTFN